MATPDSHEGLKEIDPKHPPNPLSEVDKDTLATKDDEWKPLTWEQLREVISTASHP